MTTSDLKDFDFEIHCFCKRFFRGVITLILVALSFDVYYGTAWMTVKILKVYAYIYLSCQRKGNNKYYVDSGRAT